MSGESSSLRRDRIQLSRAAAHDARFLAVLDSLKHKGHSEPGIYTQERRMYWSERLESDDTRVFVAREGGLYIGYLAVHQQVDSLSTDLVINPRQFESAEDIICALVNKAGVTMDTVKTPADTELVA